MERIWGLSWHHGYVAHLAPDAAAAPTRALSGDRWGPDRGRRLGGGRHGFLLPMRVVMAVFRGTRRAALRQGVVYGRLALPEGQRPQHMATRLHTLGRVKWHVHIRER